MGSGKIGGGSKFRRKMGDRPAGPGSKAFCVCLVKFDETGQEECIQQFLNKKCSVTKPNPCLERGSRDELLGDGNLLKQYVGTCELNKCNKKTQHQKKTKKQKKQKNKKNKKKKKKKKKKK